MLQNEKKPVAFKENEELYATDLKRHGGSDTALRIRIHALKSEHQYFSY